MERAQADYLVISKTGPTRALAVYLVIPEAEHNRVQANYLVIFKTGHTSAPAVIT